MNIDTKVYRKHETPTFGNTLLGAVPLVSEVYLMDNIELMKHYPDKYFDLAVVDPPYGLDLANMNMGAGKSKKASKIQNRKWKPKDWDKETPTTEYFLELFRVSKNQIIWGGNYFDLPPCKNYIIWDKEIPNGLSFADCEMAWTSFDKAPKMCRYSAYLDKDSKFHPTQKPKELLKRLILSVTNENDLVGDFYLGSGTTAVVCKELSRRFVGCDINPNAVKLTNERLNATLF